MWIYDDGGRKAAGFKGKAKDCVCRAVAIATGLPYAEVHAALAQGNYTQRKTHRSKPRAPTADDGIYTKRKWFRDYMASLGFAWVPTIQVGHGCRVYLRADNLPKGTLVIKVSRHVTCMIDGVLRDTYNPSRNGRRCVYGYWILNSLTVRLKPTKRKT